MLGDGVVARPAKGVTAQKAPHRQEKPYKKATFLKCLNGIGGAGRREPATGRF